MVPDKVRIVSQPGRTDQHEWSHTKPRLNEVFTLGVLVIGISQIGLIPNC